MAERLPPKTSREPTAEVEVEPDTGQTRLPPPEPPRTPPVARPLGTRERKTSVPPPPPLPAMKKAPPSPPPPSMPESATPEPSVLLGSDAITLDPDSAPLTERPTQIVQPGMMPAPGAPVPPPPPRRRSTTEPPTQAPLPAKAEQAWRTEIDILRREGEALRERDPAKAALLYGAIAQIATSVMNDPSTAAAALHAASQLLPGTGLVRERWIALLSRRDAAVSQRWDRALELGRAELPLVGDPHERVALLLDIATIEELVSGDLAHARGALEEAREIDPANVAVLEALTEIYLVEGEWEKLVAGLSSMADTTSDVVFRSMLRHGAGQIQEVMLNQRAAARASYKIALNDDMTNLPAAASLSSLALLQEDWGELARVLVAEADLVDDPRTIRRLCERAGDLYWERLGDAENSIGAYRRAALATPDEPAPLRKLAAVLESNARWRELVDVYVAEMPLIKDPEERADLHHRIGEVYEVSLGRLDDAVAAYR
ncbi:MAG: tetratricopeptide repeat protein, partial [Polyangia bacterium]